MIPWEQPERPASRTETALRAELSNIGVQAAVDAIQNLHADLGSATRLFSSPAVYVTLSAATVIVAASLVPELEVAIDGPDKTYENAINQALKVLDGHQWQNEGASGAKEQLKRFIETAEQAKSLTISESSQKQSIPGLISLSLSLSPLSFPFSLGLQTHSVVAEQTQTAQAQRQEGQPQGRSPPDLSTFAETLGDIDFSDPLWDLSWSGLYESFDAPSHHNNNFTWRF